jgi:hypothetical protein
MKEQIKVNGRTNMYRRQTRLKELLELLRLKTTSKGRSNLTEK